MRGGLSGSTLKWIAIVTMFIDHTAAALLGRIYITGRGSEGLLTAYTLMRHIGRMGFPIFCFLLVEGFQRTRNRMRYAARLGLFALVSEIPFDLAFSGRVLEFSYQNVFFTLFLGLLLLCCFALPFREKEPRAAQWAFGLFGAVLCGLWLEKALLEQDSFAAAGLMSLGVFGVWMYFGRRLWGGQTKGLGRNLAFLGVFLTLGELLRTDYGGLGVLAIAAMYLLRRFPARAMAGGCAVLSLFNSMELTAFFAVIPAALYNGKRGMRLKYFFYVFYPAHLFLLWLIAFFMGMGQVAVV